MPVSETVDVSLWLVDRGSECVEVGVGVSDRVSDELILSEVDGVSVAETLLLGDQLAEELADVLAVLLGTSVTDSDSVMDSVVDAEAESDVEMT